MGTGGQFGGVWAGFVFSHSQMQALGAPCSKSFVSAPPLGHGAGEGEGSQVKVVLEGGQPEVPLGWAGLEECLWLCYTFCSLCAL